MIIFHALDIMADACRDADNNSLQFVLEFPWNEILTDAAKQSSLSINQSSIILIIKVDIVTFLITRNILFILSLIFGLFSHDICLHRYYHHHREDTIIYQLSVTVPSLWKLSPLFSVDKILYILFLSCKDLKFLNTFS